MTTIILYILYTETIHSLTTVSSYIMKAIHSRELVVMSESISVCVISLTDDEGVVDTAPVV